jgi:FAD/FMN-containing dehydrogenase
MRPYVDLTQPHVFLDWETLGLTADCKVLSLGAAAVSGLATDSWQWDMFYRNIQTLSQTSRRQAGATYTWWQKQWAEKPALQIAMQEDTLPLDTVLKEFIEWLATLQGPYYLWGNGADFDLAILNHAMVQSRLILPAHHYTKQRCFRQLRSMYPSIKAPAFYGMPHHAGDDATHEARWFVKILNEAGYLGDQE